MACSPRLNSGQPQRFETPAREKQAESRTRPTEQRQMEFKSSPPGARPRLSTWPIIRTVALKWRYTHLGNLQRKNSFGALTGPARQSPLVKAARRCNIVSLLLQRSHNERFLLLRFSLYGHRFNIIIGEFTGVDTHPAGTHSQYVKLIVGKASGVILGGEVAAGASTGEPDELHRSRHSSEDPASALFAAQIGTHPLLTAPPTAYPVIKAAESTMRGCGR